jgi:hypothetical protein
VRYDLALQKAANAAAEGLVLLLVNGTLKREAHNPIPNLTGSFHN